MTLSTPALILLIANLGLLWLLLAAPLGFRTIRMRRIFAATPDRIWNMVYPLGRDASWSPSILSSEAAPEKGRVVQRLTHSDRKGQPISRTLEIDAREIAGGHAYDARVVEDSALDPSAWANYRERRVVAAADIGTELIVEQTDRYRGLALLVFRFFMIRRELDQLDSCLRTGTASRGGMFEHPLTQFLLAVLSTLLLWPFFGLSAWGLMISTMLTVVIALHELGHMAAYRAFGHRTVRMIFIPLLGGIAIGGRPYNTLFEVAVCALMGAGFSSLLVPMLVAAHAGLAANFATIGLAGPLLVFLLVLSAFNFLNLLPMSRFDGGQVLRQVFPTRDGLLGATFLVTAGILWTGHRIGVPLEALLGGLAVMALMSMTNNNSFKPREALDEMTSSERLHAGLGYYAVLAIHAYGLVYATDHLFRHIAG
jgi:Zn-dependent protease